MRKPYVFVSAAISFAACATLAHASTPVFLPAIAGHSYGPSKASCFAQTGFTSIDNTCSLTLNFVVPMVNHGAGGRIFFATGAPLPGGMYNTAAPWCSARVGNLSDTEVWSSAYTPALPDIYGSPAVLGDKAVSQKDTIHYICTIDPNDQPLQSVGLAEY